MINVNVFAEVETKEKNSICKETSILARLQIYSSLHDNSDTITRLEYARILAKLDAAVIPNEFNKGAFFDVEQGDPDAALIDYVYTKGYMTVIDKKFCKDDNLTAEDAIFGILKVMGYSKLAYTDCMNVAQSLGITKGMQVIKGEVNYLSLSKLLNNAIKAPMFFNVVFNDGGDNKKNILTNNLGLSYSKGIVEGIYGKYLYGLPKDINEDEIIINGEKFIITDRDINDLLGYTIEYWYKEDETKKEIFAFLADERYSSITVKFNDIDRVINNTLWYYSDGKSKRVAISDDVKILNNSMPQTNFDFVKDSDMKGDVTLVLDNKTVIYAVARQYKSYAVKKVVNGVVHFKYDITDTVDLQDDDVNYVITTDGYAGTAADIETDGIVSIAYNPDTKYCFLYISTAYVEGTVKKSYTDDDITYYTVADMDYPIDKNFKSKIEQLAKDTSKINNNEDYNFRLDIGGEIVSAESLGYGKFIYGYITKVSESEDSYPPTYQIKIYSASPKGESKYDIPEKITFNGKRVKTENVFGEIRDYYNNATALKPAICKYKLSRQGKIEALTIKIVTKLEKLSDDYITMPFEPGEYRYWNYYNGWKSTVQGSKIYITHRRGWDSAILFRIPSDRSDVSKFDVGTPENMGMRGDGDIKGDFAFYDIDDFLRPSCVVYNVKGDLNISNETEDVLGVLKVVQMLNDDDEVVYHITGYAHGVLVEYDVNDESLYPIIKSLKKGDFIIYVTDGMNKITNAELYMSADQKKFNNLKAKWIADSSDSTSLGKWMLVARIYESEQNYIKLYGDITKNTCIISPESEYRRFLHTGGFTIYDCNTKEYIYGAYWDDLNRNDLICGVTKTNLMYNFIALRNAEFSDFEDIIPEHLK